jgi:colicin import membrane protein
VRIGLATSLLLHLALLGWAMFTYQRTPELRPSEPEPISVAMITPSEFLRLKQGSLTATQLEAKAKDEPKPADTSQLEANKPNPVLAPTPPQEAPKPEPKPEPAKPAAEAPPPEPAKPEPAKPEPPKPDPIAEKLAEAPPPAPGPSPEQLKQEEEAKKKAEDDKKKAEEQKKKDEEKKKAEKKKADEAKKKLAEAKRKKEEEEKKKKEQASVSDRMAALLNKDPTKKGAPNTNNTPPTKPTDATGPTAGADRGNDSVLSVREQDLLASKLRQQLARCWKLPGAGGGAAQIPVVKLEWRLRRDGTLEGEPRIVTPGGGPLGGLANESAMRAVQNCQPYDLPADLYDGWKDVIWEFDPSQLM